MGVEELSEELYRKYGPFELDYFGPNYYGRHQEGHRWRVWFRNWHIHMSKASYGDLVGYGRTIEDALRWVIEAGENPKYHIQQGHCAPGCPEYVHDLY